MKRGHKEFELYFFAGDPTRINYERCRPDQSAEASTLMLTSIL